MRKILIREDFLRLGEVSFRVFDFVLCLRSIRHRMPRRLRPRKSNVWGNLGFPPKLRPLCRNAGCVVGKSASQRAFVCAGRGHAAKGMRKARSGVHQAGKGKRSSLCHVMPSPSVLDQAMAVEHRMHRADRRRVDIRIEASARSSSACPASSARSVSRSGRTPWKRDLTLALCAPNLLEMKLAVAMVLLMGLLVLARSSMPKGDATEVHVWNFGAVDRTCQSWTDGCVSCDREQAPAPDRKSVV